MRRRNPYHMDQMSAWEELMTRPFGTIGQLVVGSLGGLMIAIMVSMALLK